MVCVGCMGEIEMCCDCSVRGGRGRGGFLGAPWQPRWELGGHPWGHRSLSVTPRVVDYDVGELKHMWRLRKLYSSCLSCLALYGHMDPMIRTHPNE